jgi:hypothetical protein
LNNRSATETPSPSFFGARVVGVATWLYFENTQALAKWLEEVIMLHERWGHNDWAREYRDVLKIVKQFDSYVYSRKCFGYFLLICDHIVVVALCRDGEVLKPVDVEEWLEYADL